MIREARLSPWDIWTIIRVPAVITLGVTILRLVGELQRWSETLFARNFGARGALVGIAWLAPIFGVYFASRLYRDGHTTRSLFKMAVFSICAAVIGMGAVVFGQTLYGHGSPHVLAFRLVGTVGGLWLVWRGWPDLTRTLIAYALAARVPVVLIMLTAIYGNWGTHYDVSPINFPAMSPLAKWFHIGLAPQLSFWVVYTVTSGSLCGAASVLLAHRLSAD